MKKLIKILILLLLIFLGYKCFQTYRTVKQVMAYQPMVREILAENDTSANEELILAMIYTETKGREVDVMQSSESASGSANTITDSKESIRQGIVYLTEKLRLAEEKGVGVWTAVQAYNFGPAYIDYIAEHGGEHTLALAEEYSKNVVAPSLGNTTQETYTYYHPIALLNGGKLYVNGGNIYYARQVRFNMHLMRFINLF
ncbi:lysozyme family protein [Streptococcus ruminantium]|uniref:Lysozyme family protein n=1 Tax=Streptococcus ruminantium TaxID=1917441 RepID=A0ABU1B2P7_9STRE|nr:lysozyme family protein [Streptococcus ruminantium]MDQ8758432.1 lysozyme family protein [Streptococcus ruminantium]MDQ8764837.1 lysozyme family protein [Streptococcus ruminantium]MDQ8768206.1 lysozyme family protein [Streptococcus ruminantium]MDQ8773896.1 lysozyme family protein [Streptococcus ruminantium]MDQ8779962.1 lysozyme family protein [Streptococcus ruminantium]